MVTTEQGEKFTFLLSGIWEVKTSILPSHDQGVLGCQCLLWWPSLLQLLQKGDLIAPSI